ncbi:hypothetical protein [Alteromonas sp. M12]|uniref:hypothetical protein n=1 Tax=Alteromonas sp. M12 TaxID=3135644 RepID=UPI00319D8D00
MKQYIIAITLCFMSLLTNASCKEKVNFVDAFNVFKDDLQKVSQFELAYEDFDSRYGRVTVNSILFNLLSIEYEFETGGKGVFLLAADFNKETFHFSHMMENAGVPSKFIAGKSSEGYCVQTFIDGGAGFKVSMTNPIAIEYFTLDEEVENKLATYFLSGD